MESHSHNSGALGECSKDQKGWLAGPRSVPQRAEAEVCPYDCLTLLNCFMYLYIYIHTHFQEEAALCEGSESEDQKSDTKVCSTSTEQLISLCVSFCKWILNYCFFLLEKDSDLSLLIACIEKQSSYSAVALLWPDFPPVQWFSSIDFTAAVFSHSG